MKVFKIPKWESTSISEEIFSKVLKKKKVKEGRVKKKVKLIKDKPANKKVKNKFKEQIGALKENKIIKNKDSWTKTQSSLENIESNKTKLEKNVRNESKLHKPIKCLQSNNGIIKKKKELQSKIKNKLKIKKPLNTPTTPQFSNSSNANKQETYKSSVSKLNKNNHNIKLNQTVSNDFEINNQEKKTRRKQLTHQTMFFRKLKHKENLKKPTGVPKVAHTTKTPEIYKESWRKLSKLPLRERMMEKLKASRFRYLNEQMYTSTGKEAKQYFDSDISAFQAYHEGYRLQVSRWPVNPIDVLISKIKKFPRDRVIADFGCGDAKLAKSVPHKVHSFDLVAVDEKVTACDMAHVPLKNDSIDVVVFCLSLMGTNLKEYLTEAKRVLKNNGLLMIAEVESRFENIDKFISDLRSYGFVNESKDLSHNLFCFLSFVLKPFKNIPSQNLPNLSLKPCLYKKR